MQKFTSRNEHVVQILWAQLLVYWFIHRPKRAATNFVWDLHSLSLNCL